MKTKEKIEIIKNLMHQYDVSFLLLVCIITITLVGTTCFMYLNYILYCGTHSYYGSILNLEKGNYTCLICEDFLTIEKRNNFIEICNEKAKKFGNPRIYEYNGIPIINLIKGD